MRWNKEITQNLKWANDISNIEAKTLAAKEIAQFAKNGDIIGFGSGSTSFLTVQELANRILRENISIYAIPTSKEIELACYALQIPVVSLNQIRPDWCFDGTDEVNNDGWLIKGRGGAMFKEKLIMSSCNKRYIVVDESKIVTELGEKFPVPVEIHPDSLCHVKARLISFGAWQVDLRLAKKKDGPVITENGNFILDAFFKNIQFDLESKIKNVCGVIESGLFIDYNIELICCK